MFIQLEQGKGVGVDAVLQEHLRCSSITDTCYARPKEYQINVWKLQNSSHQDHTL